MPGDKNRFSLSAASLKLIGRRASQRWPMPQYQADDEPHFLFIITPPFTGSTALAKFINTSCRTMFLEKNGEGHWLIPGMCGLDRMNPKMAVNYNSVKAVWMHRYQSVNRLVGTIDVVIEKSPPNIVRMEKISSLFKNSSFLANNRDPYATCSSILYRQYLEKTHSRDVRNAALREIASLWIERGARVRDLVEKFDIPMTTYERFCESPLAVVRTLGLPERVKESIDMEANFRVKDYPQQGIQNQNARQLDRLDSDDIKTIGSVLREHTGLLDYFGYELK